MQKQHGPAPIEVSIFVLNSKNLADTNPAVEHVFELIQPKSSARWVTFTLGAANPFNRRVPRNKIRRNFCRFEFKGTRCGYRGGATKCNRSLANCRALGNSERFGGFPGV